MKTSSKLTSYSVHSFAAVALLLTAQISLAGSATWLSSPQDSAWENPNNWTAGGPPNGPSDVATFAQSPQTSVNLSTSEEVNSIVFASNSNSFTLNISPYCVACSPGGELIISGTGVINNNSVRQRFEVGEAGQIIFNNTSTAGSAHMSIYNYDPGFGIGGRTIFNDTSSAGGASIGNGSYDFGINGDIGYTFFNDASTADHASISNYGAGGSHGDGGQTIFNDTSTAGNASIENFGSAPASTAGSALTIFNDASTAGHATITNQAGDIGGETIFTGSSTAGSSTLIANEGFSDTTSAIIFDDASTGGTARVKVFGVGRLDIRNHQSNVTIGSIEGSGHVFLGANRLRVGTNNINTSFAGLISNDGLGGSLAKVGSGVLTLQHNECIADTVGLLLVSGSIINLDFAGPPDVIASLRVNGVSQPPGIYGGPMSSAPHILPEFGRGLGTVEAGPISTLGNISTRAFVQRGDNVVIGGFIVQGAERKKVVIRAIGPELAFVGNALANPTLELHDGTGALIASNDNWGTTIIGGIITSNQVAAIRDSGYAPTDPRESAIIATLPPGSYTAIVRGVDDMIGVALVEVYDLSPAPNSILENISTRSFVRTGNNVMIGGVIVQGTHSRRVIVRAIGPELTQFGVPNALANPTLELHSLTRGLIASNNHWQHTIIGGIITSDQVHDIVDSGHAPTDPRESAIIATLPPGNYTAIVRGVNDTTGVALVEVYDLD
jgi:hypothetical protein